jgi:hypothetical protein
MLLINGRQEECYIKKKTTDAVFVNIEAMRSIIDAYCIEHGKLKIFESDVGKPCFLCIRDNRVGEKSVPASWKDIANENH